MKKLLSVLLLGLTLLLTGCGDQPGAKPGEQFVGVWKGSDNYSQYEIKRNGDSEDCSNSTAPPSFPCAGAAKSPSAATAQE